MGQPAVAVKVGEGTLPLKVDSEIIATNQNNTATGVFRLTNDGKEPVTVSNRARWGNWLHLQQQLRPLCKWFLPQLHEALPLIAADFQLNLAEVPLLARMRYSVLCMTAASWCTVFDTCYCCSAAVAAPALAIPN